MLKKLRTNRKNKQKIAFSVRHYLDSNTIYEILSSWNKSAVNYKNNKKIKANLDNMKHSTENVISDLRRGLRVFSKIEKKYSDNSYNEAIPTIQEDIKVFSLNLAFITTKKYQFNQDNIMLRGMMEIFILGENLGLKSMDKPSDGGRGNKNRLLEFARIITGIENKKILYGYYRKYKKLKKDFA